MRRAGVPEHEAAVSTQLPRAKVGNIPICPRPPCPVYAVTPGYVTGPSMNSSVEGIMAFGRTHSLARLGPPAVLPRPIHGVATADAVFPEGIAFDGNRFNRTAVTAPLFHLLGAVRILRKVVSRKFTSWNRIGQWLRHVDGLRQRPEPSAAACACAIGNVAASLGTENP